MTIIKKIPSFLKKGMGYKNNIKIKIYAELVMHCVKLGSGKMYDDHCASSYIIKDITFNRDEIGGDDISVVTDIDIFSFRGDINIELYIDKNLRASLKASKEDLEAIFVEKNQVYTYPNIFVGWVSCLPKLGAFNKPELWTDDLSKIWDIPDDLEWFHEGMYEAEIEPDAYLELGHLNKKFAFVRKESEKELVKKSNELIDWLIDDIGHKIKNIESRINTSYWINGAFIKVEGSESSVFSGCYVYPSADKLNTEVIETRYTLKGVSEEKIKYFIEKIKYLKDLTDKHKEIALCKKDGLKLVYLYNKNEKYLNIQVQKDVMGLVIGRGGSNIKKIQEENGIKINLKEMR